MKSDGDKENWSLIEDDNGAAPAAGSIINDADDDESKEWQSSIEDGKMGLQEAPSVIKMGLQEAPSLIRNGLIGELAGMNDKPLLIEDGDGEWSILEPLLVGDGERSILGSEEDDDG